MELVVAVLALGALVGWMIKKRRARPPRGQTSDHTRTVTPQRAPEPAPVTSRERDSIWASAAEADALLGDLAPGDDLPLTLEFGPGGLLPTTPDGKHLAPGNRHLNRLGIHWLNARGAQYYQDERAQIMIRPGDPVILKREPENEHDPNAIAVQREGLTLGYVNKGLARRLAKRMDRDEYFRAVALRLEPLSIIVGTPERLAKIGL